MTFEEVSIQAEKQDKWLEEVLKDSRKKAFKTDKTQLWIYYTNQSLEEESEENPNKELIEELDYKSQVVSMLIAHDSIDNSGWKFDYQRQRWYHPQKSRVMTPREAKEYKKQLAKRKREEKKLMEKHELENKKKEEE